MLINNSVFPQIPMEIFSITKTEPYMNITRAEASVMIYNTEKQIAYLKSGSINRFKDYKFIPNWAVESVGAISNSNIINGYPDKTFAPSKNITKQEAFVIIAKLVIFIRFEEFFMMFFCFLSCGSVM